MDKTIPIFYHLFGANATPHAPDHARRGLKLLKAQLIRHRKQPIAVLTHELGYSNPRSAKNLFLKAFGTTMSDWRKQEQTPPPHGFI